MFFEQYRKWLDDCLIEFNDERTENRLYHQESAPEDCDPGELVEFAEDGDAYPHGIGGTGHIPRAVTPWEESPHYSYERP